jgi:hypothetical protein
MRKKRGIAWHVGQLTMGQAHSALAALSSKNGMKGFKTELKLAGSKVSVGDVKNMLRRRMAKLKKK